MSLPGGRPAEEAGACGPGAPPEAETAQRRDPGASANSQAHWCFGKTALEAAQRKCREVDSIVQEPIRKELCPFGGLLSDRG